MNLDYLGCADSRIHTVLYAVARRRDRGRLVIFSAASYHEKDTGRFIGRDLPTPFLSLCLSLSREREGREGYFIHFISYIKRICVGVSHLVS